MSHCRARGARAHVPPYFGCGENAPAAAAAHPNNSGEGLSRIACAARAHVRNVPSSVPPNSTLRKKACLSPYFGCGKTLRSSTRTNNNLLPLSHYYPPSRRNPPMCGNLGILYKLPEQLYVTCQHTSTL